MIPVLEDKYNVSEGLDELGRQAVHEGDGGAASKEVEELNEEQFQALVREQMESGTAEENAAEAAAEAVVEEAESQTTEGTSHEVKNTRTICIASFYAIIVPEEESNSKKFGTLFQNTSSLTKKFLINWYISWQEKSSKSIRVPTNKKWRFWQKREISGIHIFFTFSNEEGDSILKDTRNLRIKNRSQSIKILSWSIRGEQR